MDESELKSVTESLYKQNLELAVINKTLSLLRKLYEISILTLTPKELAEKISRTIQEDFSFELVGIFNYNETEDDLSSLALAESGRFQKAQSNSRTFIDSLSIPKAKTHTFFGPVI